MASVSDLLRDADPLRDEPGHRDDERRRVREAVRAAASAPLRVPSRAKYPGVVPAVGLLLLIAVAAAGARIWLGGGATLHAAAVSFEVRLAETTFSPGLREARIAGADRVIYLHPETIVTNEDILRSTVVSSGTGFGVAVTFTRAGADKMQRATAAHLNAPLALLVDGEVIAAPTLRSPIGAEAIVSGNYTRAEAERIAEGMRIR